MWSPSLELSECHAPASSPGQSQSQWGPWDSPSDNIGFGMDSCCILPSFFLETMVCLPAANCWSSWSSTASCHVLVHCLWCPMDSLFWSMSFQLRTFQLPSGILIPPLSFPGSVLACLFSHLNAPVLLIFLPLFDLSVHSLDITVCKMDAFGEVQFINYFFSGTYLFVI